MSSSYRHFTLILFFFVQIKNPKGPPKRAEILLSGLKDLLLSLLSNPVNSNLICAVKLLKVSAFRLVGFVKAFLSQSDIKPKHLSVQLTGSVLDDAWRESGKPHMEELIQRIETILLDAKCDRSVEQDVSFLCFDQKVYLIVIYIAVKQCSSFELILVAESESFFPQKTRQKVLSLCTLSILNRSAAFQA